MLLEKLAMIPIKNMNRLMGKIEKEMKRDALTGSPKYMNAYQRLMASPNRVASLARKAHERINSDKLGIRRKSEIAKMKEYGIPPTSGSMHEIADAVQNLMHSQQHPAFFK